MAAASPRAAAMLAHSYRIRTPMMVASVGERGGDGRYRAAGLVSMGAGAPPSGRSVG